MSITNKYIIHLALAAPGAGKTQSFISQAPKLLSQGQRIVLAVPTKSLAESISKRCKTLTHKVIHSSRHNSATLELEETLASSKDNLIITTHESLFQLKPHLLSEWIVVLDETPHTLSLPYYWFDTNEIEKIYDVAYEQDGQLHIKPEHKLMIESELKTYNANAAGLDQTSLLSKSAAVIFQALAANRPVFIDQAENGRRCIRPILEIDCWSRISAAREVHIMTACIQESLFESFAKIHGFKFRISIFSPTQYPYQCSIKIYPLLPQGRNFSKSVALKHFPGVTNNKRNEPSQQRIIDFMLEAALNHSDERPLLFNNSWANFDWLESNQVIPCNIDSRGLNDYSDSRSAILLFGGNPSPAEQLGLQFLSEKYNFDLTSSFVTTRYLEPSLQAATRTAVRDRNNAKEIRLYVQDERVAKYLIQTYMPNATVNWGLACNLSFIQDQRQKDDERKHEAFKLFSLGKTNAETCRLAGIHRNTASNWRKEWAASAA